MHEEYSITTKAGLEGLLIYRFNDSDGLPDGWYLFSDGRELFIPLHNIIDRIDAIDPDDKERLLSLPERYGSLFGWQNWQPPRKVGEIYIISTETRHAAAYSVNELRSQVQQLGELVGITS